ncbi:hypothetical protein [Streptomyces decoyicus]|uniref:hypothetical protein n=1 Tax=Streptomyces decoyicus TaxID=249567 RepID=UPI0036580253
MVSTRKRRMFLAALPATFMVALSACAGGASAELHKVSGLRDDVRHIHEKAQPATRPHMISVCTTRPKRTPHTATTRVGGVTKTRRWVTIETARDCRMKQRGTETYMRVVRTERWCVELDDVGGNRRRDDVWFRVDPHAYAQALDVNEGEKIAITPRADGC